MAKLEVWQPADEEGEEKVLLTLRESGRGNEIDLIAVDEDGDEKSYLLTITPKGFIRVECIDEDLGFPLDKNGRLLEVENA